MFDSLQREPRRDFLIRRRSAQTRPAAAGRATTEAARPQGRLLASMISGYGQGTSWRPSLAGSEKKATTRTRAALDLLVSRSPYHFFRNCCPQRGRAGVAENTKDVEKRGPKANAWATGPPWAVTIGDPAQPGAKRQLALTGACWCWEFFRSRSNQPNHRRSVRARGSIEAPPLGRLRPVQGGPRETRKNRALCGPVGVVREKRPRWQTQKTTDRSNAAMGAMVAGTTGAQGG